MTHIDTTFTITVEGSDGNAFRKPGVDSYCLITYKHIGKDKYATFEHIEIEAPDMLLDAAQRLQNAYGLYSE